MSTRHEAEEQGTVEADKHHFMRCEHANCNFETINTSFMADHHLQTHTNYIMRFGILEHLYKFTPMVQQLECDSPDLEELEGKTRGLYIIYIII
jgi:hypothetical protein